MGRIPRTSNDLKRRKPYKKIRDRILIVCEGEKTEPYYFTFIRNELRLTSAEVRIIGKECGSAPISVVDYAIGTIKSEKENPYDQVWCVFDVEIPPHDSLNQAYDRVVNFIPPRKSPTTLKVAITNPIFEYWYILHFEKTGSRFQSNRDVIDHLKIHIPEYHKNDKDVPASIYSKLPDAIKNAGLIIKENEYVEDLRTCCPSTHVHRLVTYLQEVANR